MMRICERLLGLHLKIFASLIFAAASSMSLAASDTLTGSALIRERIALPASTVFEVIIEDIARADAPATPLARTVIEDPGQPPIAFSIDYDRSSLDPRAIYALRATIRHKGRLLFTTDTITQVLQDGDPREVEVIMKMVQRQASGAMPGIDAHGLRLPATFQGTLPCADCEGVVHHLDLWPDQTYHMHREWLAEDPLRRDEIGRWYADPARGAIVLHGASEMPLFWEVKATDRLRQMDMQGNPITSELPYDLTSQGSLNPTDLDGLFLLGMMTYLADAALFEECISGRRYPIAIEGDYLALERAYLAERPAPGAPLLVHVEGGLITRPAMEGPDRKHLVVNRFNRTLPGETCPPHVSTASLTNTYWRIDTLMGEALMPVDDRREPHLVLHDDPKPRFRATVGCNQLVGGYERNGDELTFAAAASTMMACPPPIDAAERNLRAVLEATHAVRQTGQTLVLQDAEGQPIAEFAAVYLR
jgi:uncharacterized lipoprotein YbaY/heat shock protein HslJ/uncharacterized lipoprotein NlpE involved in copper resistance